MILFIYSEPCFFHFAYLWDLSVTAYAHIFHAFESFVVFCGRPNYCS